ncbi:MAG: ABC transporter permease [Muribaculaceae bacterium]|nr:ABC transporter permease [Muribaculaceae bacterium]
MNLLRGLAPRVAWRYLWVKKAYGAVSAIAVVSVVGVAVATAAILCVLSVFNGFRDVLSTSSSRIQPDILVTPREGKVIDDGDMLAAEISEITGVEVAMPAIEDQALVIFNSMEMPVMLRGVVPSEFRRLTSIDSLIVAGSPMPDDAIEHETPLGLISVGVGQRLSAYNPGEDPIFIFAPRREGRINPANPLSSFFTDSIVVAGVFKADQSEYDATSVYVPIDVARGLFQYDTEASSIQVKVGRGADISSTAENIAMHLNGSPLLGEPDDPQAEFIIKDRARLEEVSFRMVEIEKWVTALLLFFILVIASFNIISTMTMFVLEKRRSLSTLRALGMSKGRIGAVFGWESVYVSMLGGIGGIILGAGLTLLQEYYGLIRIEGTIGGESIPYPVRLAWADVGIVLAAIAVVGMVTAMIAASFARSRISEKRQ